MRGGDPNFILSNFSNMGFSPHMRGYFWFQQNAVGLAGWSCIRVSAGPAGQS